MFEIVGIERDEFIMANYKIFDYISKYK